MVSMPHFDEPIRASVLHGVRVKAATALVPFIHSPRTFTHELQLEFQTRAPARRQPQLAGEVIALQRWQHTTEYVFTRDKNSVHFLFPDFCAGIADLDGGTVTLHASSVNDAGLVFPNTVLSALLGPAPDVVLHASAVRNDRGTIAFCGTSGAGKSSLATALSLAGHAVVSDDALRLRVSPGPEISCFPGVSELRLRQTRSWSLAPERLRMLADERVGYLPPRCEHDETELRALVFPVVSIDTEVPGLDRVRGERGLQLLLRASRIAWTGPAGAEFFKLIARVQRSVPLFVLHLPRTYLDSAAHPHELSSLLIRKLESS